MIIATMTSAQTPGGVSGGLQLWLKADVGVTGSPVFTWEDQSGNTKYTPANGNPTLLSNVVNYNPAIDFDGDGDSFTTTTTDLIASGSYTKNAIISSDNTSSIRTIVRGGNFDSYHWMYFSQSHTNLRSGTFSPYAYFDGPSILSSTTNIAVNRYGPGGPTNICRIGGSSIENDQNIPYTSAGTHQIGNIYNLSGFAGEFDGYISEIIVYDSELNDSKLHRIESYLSIKYGITRNNTSGGSSGDYISATGATIWDASNNANYHNNVTRIGGDLASSDLEQNKSRSINEESIVVMEAKSPYSSDGDYNLWRSDLAGNDFTYQNGHPSFPNTFETTWKVAVKGSSGTVSISLITPNNTGNASDYTLLIDAIDNDLSSGAVEHTTGVSFSGDTISFSSVNFMDGDFFSFAVNLCFPGGVAIHNKLWLKGDQGPIGSPTVTDWLDQSNYKYAHNTIANGSPRLLNAAINYNHAIEFISTSSEWFTTSRTGLIGNNNPYTKIAVALVNNTGVNRNIIAPTEGGNHCMYFPATSTPLILGHGPTVVSSDPNVTFDSPMIVMVRYGAGNTSNISSLNGSRNTHSPAAHSFTDLEANTQIGRFNSTPALALEELIAEAILYDADLSDDNINKIESYLAIKYGQTLDNSLGNTQGNYTSSKGSLLWDANQSPNYQNDIIAIGRDDRSDLKQKQSHSENDTVRVYLRSLETTNSANLGSFSSDDSFVIIGHDGRQVVSTTSEVNSDSFIIQRSKDRENWKKIYKINARGNTQEQTSYYFSDSSPLPNLNYYRLKQLDLDGTYEFSKIISVNINAKKVPKIYPKPFYDQITIEGELIILEDIKILNMQCQDVSSKVQYIEKENSTIRLNLEQLKSSIHYTKVQNNYYKILKM